MPITRSWFAKGIDSRAGELSIARMRSSSAGARCTGGLGLTLEVQAVALIRVERAVPVTSPAYNRGDTEEQVKERWPRYWRKLWDKVEE
jgi:hypothetical protein